MVPAPRRTVRDPRNPAPGVIRRWHIANPYDHERCALCGQRLALGGLVNIEYKAGVMHAACSDAPHLNRTPRGQEGQATGELLAGELHARTERWLEQEGTFTVPRFGDVEPAGGLYLRQLDGGQLWCADITVTVRPASPGEAGVPQQSAGLGELHAHGVEAAGQGDCWGPR